MDKTYFHMKSLASADFTNADLEAIEIYIDKDKFLYLSKGAKAEYVKERIDYYMSDNGISYEMGYLYYEHIDKIVSLLEYRFLGLD